MRPSAKPEHFEGAAHRSSEPRLAGHHQPPAYRSRTHGASRSLRKRRGRPLPSKTRRASTPWVPTRKRIGAWSS